MSYPVNTLGTHYSIAMNPKAMHRWANTEAKKIKALLASTNLEFPVLIYTGMSGINHAAYLSMSLTRHKVDFGQIYVRKDKEISHGCPLEYTTNVIRRNKPFLLVFVDDFISTGSSLKSTVLKAMAVKRNGFLFNHLYIAVQRKGNPNKIWEELIDENRMVLMKKFKTVSCGNECIDSKFSSATEVTKNMLRLK